MRIHVYYFSGTGNTAWVVKRLAERLTELGDEVNVLVANNLRLPLLSPLPIPSQEEMVRKLERAADKVEQLAGWIHRRERHMEGAGVFGRLLGVCQRASVGPFEALAFRGFFADETCTRCGWCVRHCPAQNIEIMANGVAFLDRCMLCMRCYSFCPRQAIQSTEKTKDARRYRRYQGPEGTPYPFSR
jgi:ferredoxin